MKYLFKITVIALWIPMIALGATERQEKSKSFKKSYTVNSDAKVSISNKYGTVNVTSWNQNRVEIDVKITVKGNDLDAVEKRLNTIDVAFEGSASYVKAETLFNNAKRGWNLWGNKRNMNYQIDYVVKLPVSNSVSLSNDYGSIYLNAIDGNASINCDYGKIIIGSLNGAENSINLDYSNASTITSVNDVNINSDYSTLTISKAANVSLNADYSNITLEDAKAVNYNTDYGKIIIKKGVAIIGNSDYTHLTFGTIKDAISLKADYGSIKITDLQRGFSSVTIDSDYAGINIQTSSNDFDFKLDLQYSNFKQERSDAVQMRKSEKKSSKKYFEGSYGRGNSNSIVQIKSSYGNVSISNK